MDEKRNIAVIDYRANGQHLGSVCLNPMHAFNGLAELGEVPTPNPVYYAGQNWFSGLAGQGSFKGTVALLGRLKNDPVLRAKFAGGEIDLSGVELGSIFSNIWNTAKKIGRGILNAVKAIDKGLDKADEVVETAGKAVRAGRRVSDDVKRVYRDTKDIFTEENIERVKEAAKDRYWNAIDGMPQLGASAKKQIKQEIVDVLDELGPGTDEAVKALRRVIKLLQLSGANVTLGELGASEKLGQLGAFALLPLIAKGAGWLASALGAEGLARLIFDGGQLGELGFMPGMPGQGKDSILSMLMLKKLSQGQKGQKSKPGYTWVKGHFRKLGDIEEYDFAQEDPSNYFFGSCGCTNPIEGFLGAALPARACEKYKTDIAERALHGALGGLNGRSDRSMLAELGAAEAADAMTDALNVSPLAGRRRFTTPTLGEYELASHAAMLRHPRLGERWRRLAGEMLAGNWGEVEKHGPDKLDMLLGMQYLGLMDNSRPIGERESAQIGQLGSWLSNIANKFKTASQNFVQPIVNTINQAGQQIQRYIQPAQQRQDIDEIKRRTNEVNMEAAELARLKQQAARAAELEEMLAEEGRKVREITDQLKQSQQLSLDRREGLQTGFDELKTQFEQVQQQRAAAERAFEKKRREFDNLKNDYERDMQKLRHDYEMALEREKMRVDIAEKLYEAKAQMQPQSGLDSQLIMMTPREYAERVKKEEDAVKAAHAAEEKLQVAVKQVEAALKKLAEQDRQMLELKEQYAEVSRRLLERSQSAEVKEQVEREKEALLQRLQSIKDSFSDELYRIRNMADENIKAAGDQINQQGLTMMFGFFDKLANAMRQMKDISQVGEFLKFFPEILNSMKMATEINRPELPTIEIPTPQIDVDVQVPDQKLPDFFIKPDLTLSPNITNQIPAQAVQVKLVPVPISNVATEAAPATETASAAT